jgi:hypothetical protein
MKQIALVVFALCLSLTAQANPPPAALCDNGDCGLGAGTTPTRTAKGKTYTARSWFETASRVAVGGIQAADLDALGAQVSRLKDNHCYDVCLRAFANGSSYTTALGQCDLVYVVAHGSTTSPYLVFGGDPATVLQQFPQPSRAGSVWVGSCMAQQIVTQGNAGGGTKFKTMGGGSFQQDGTALRSDIIKGLTAELATLTDTQCELAKKVCILAGVQEVGVSQ